MHSVLRLGSSTSPGQDGSGTSVVTCARGGAGSGGRTWATAGAPLDDRPHVTSARSGQAQEFKCWRA